MIHNKIRTHEYKETSKSDLTSQWPIGKITEIKKNNKHLLDRLLYISKGKNCPVNQKNLRVEKAASKSLNNANLQREARRIDEENQKIMYRIMNAKPHIPQADQLHLDYVKTQQRQKKLFKDKHQGIRLDEMILMKLKYREGAGNRTSLLPRISPTTSTNYKL